ncbi:MAG: nucleoside-diphosphate kinase, partial [Desulfocucumaceae bacterium]
EMMGATNPLKAVPGTIRATYAMDLGRNIIHGSDSKASADREIGIFFLPGELVDYGREIDRWIYE